MKNAKFLLLVALVVLISEAHAQFEFKIVTSIESIVPMGLVFYGVKYE